MQNQVNLELLESLEELTFRPEIIDWFKEQYGDKTIEAWEVIERMKETKYRGFGMQTLFERFKLSGECEIHWQYIFAKATFKNGKLETIDSMSSYI